MKKILVLTDKPFAPVAIEGIKKEIENAGFTLALLEKYTSREQATEAISNAEAAIVRSDIVDAELIAAAKKLQILVRAGAGYDNIDLNAATRAGICVMNTPGQNSNAVAELVFGLMVFAVRNFFNGTSGTELKDKKLGIHAYGNVGRNVARIARGFGMEIYAFDPFLKAEDIEKERIIPVAKVEELYKNCDIVSLHIPATEETKKSINYSLLNNLPKNGILLNTARKEVIDENDLLKIMTERNDIKYLTDVLPDNHALLTEHCAARYFSTPKKMGAQTAEANINAGIAAAQQIVDFFKTGNQKFRVNV